MIGSWRLRSFRLALLVSALSATMPLKALGLPAAAPAPPRRLHSPRLAPLDIAKANGEAHGRDQAILEAIAVSSSGLMARLKSGAPDPKIDAASAARAGRFGLIWVRPFGTPGLPGVTCIAPDFLPAGRIPLEAAEVFISDAEFSDEVVQSTERAVAYAEAYNRAMVAQPGFPYGDICKPAVGLRPYVRRWLGEPKTFAVWDKRPWNRTRSLGQAVRQGSLGDVRRWLAKGPQIDALDDFELTPLAWAVVRGRHDVIAALLARGADPLASLAAGKDFATTPLALAMRLHDRSSIDRFAPQNLRDRFGTWPQAIVETAAETGPPHLLRRILRDPHEFVEPEILRTKAAEAHSAANRSVIDAAEAAKCWHAATPDAARIRLISVYGDGGTKRVTLEPTGEPVILALASYEPTTWKIEARAAAQLVGVFAIGYHPPEVTGVAPGVPVLINSVDSTCESFSRGSQAGDERAQLRELVTNIEAMIHRRVLDVAVDHPDPDGFVVAGPAKTQP